MEDEVVLLGFWTSPFAMGVRIALAEKEIKYEYREENLPDKSPLLLKMNPVHKKVPVLIHNGKPICESLNILYYIDEIWQHKFPLLPSDPYQRAVVRFWGDYINKKIYDCMKRIYLKKGEEQEKAKNELIECFKTLEGELGEKDFFGGEIMGLVDVALIPFYCRFYATETCGNFSIEAECPKLVAWAKRCSEKESVSKSLADPHKLYDFVLQLQKMFGVE